MNYPFLSLKRASITKDYYKTLGILSGADIQEIKRAYRKLAKQFHPDKNQQDPGAAIQFREIQEAYSVLSNPIKREQYHHERWATRNFGKSYQAPPISTAYGLLLRAIELEQFMQLQDPFRIDKSGLLLLLQGLLAADNIKILQYNQDSGLNARIVRIILSSVKLLEYKHLIQLTPILALLAPEMSVEIKQYTRQSKRAAQWRKIAPWVIIFITLLICGAIYYLGKP